MTSPAKSNLKEMELTRNTVGSLKRRPVQHHCDALGMVIWIKPLKLRKALELLGDVGSGQSVAQNVESILRLASEAITDREGNRIFETLEDCEEAIGHVLLELQEPILRVQGLSNEPAKKK